MNNLRYDDWAELNKIKAITTELIKRSFPTDYSSAVLGIEAITFKVKPGYGFPIDGWNEGLGTLIGIIEAKKETFDLKANAYSNLRNGLQPLSKVMGNNKSDAEINRLKQEKIELLKILGEKNIELEKAKSKFRKYNGTFWTIIIGIPSLLFFIGYYLGNNRFDAEKLSMRDSIIKLNSEKNIINNNILNLNRQKAKDSIQSLKLQKQKDTIINVLFHKKNDSVANLDLQKKKVSKYYKRPILRRRKVYYPN